MVRFRFSPRPMAALVALSLALPLLADEITKTKPTPPNFSGSGKPPAPPPLANPPRPADDARPADAGTSGANASPVVTPPVQVGAPVPVPPINGAAAGDFANPADARGFLYERRRIKRTVPLDPKAGLEGRWDLLYALGEGESRKAVYFNWDDDYLYLAAESAVPTDVRFDIDARGDGWFRGADNLTFTVSPPAAEGGLPRVTAQRWDTVQNKDRPVWAASPVPVSALKAAVGRTSPAGRAFAPDVPASAGTYAALLAVPRTEMVGLPRRAGASFGFRAEFGLPPALGDAALFSPRPMLPLVLADSLDAREGGLRVQVRAEPRQVVPGAGVKLALEVRNEGAEPVRLARLFLRGSQAAQPLLDAATFTGQVLMPGQKMTRELQSTVSGGAGLGTLVVAGGAEREDGTALAALAAFDRVDPFAVSLTVEDRPILAGAAERRTALVTLRSRDNRRVRGTVALQLPPGWTVEGGERTREVPLSFAGEIRGVYYRIAVPASAAPGEYPVQADVRIAGRAYAAGGTVVVTQSVAAP